MRRRIVFKGKILLTIQLNLLLTGINSHVGWRPKLVGKSGDQKYSFPDAFASREEGGQSVNLGWSSFYAGGSDSANIGIVALYQIAQNPVGIALFNT